MTGQCIICHDTKLHDRVRSKQHTSTRHAKACHFTVWSCISSLARHGRDNSLADQGAMPAQGLATFTILRRRKDCGLRNCVIVRQSVSPNTFRKVNASITVMKLSFEQDW